MIENRFISSLKSRSGSENNRLGSGCIVFLFILALISITICSKSSPLYPLNNWDDANCFYTVGRATLNGQVMYRDIFEQKGPWLYFIYMLASLISGSCFSGPLRKDNTPFLRQKSRAADAAACYNGLHGTCL